MEQILFTLAGAVMTTLSGAVVVLWNKNNELSDKRLQDLKEISEKTNTTILGLTEMTQKIYDALPDSETKRGK